VKKMMMKKLKNIKARVLEMKSGIQPLIADTVFYTIVPE
jgi:hypothetical protein